MLNTKQVQRLFKVAPVALCGAVLIGATSSRSSGSWPGAMRADSVNWKAVDAAMGRSGAMQPGDVYKYGLARSDLTVRVGDVVLKPALALGAWVAFKATGNQAMAMGDVELPPSMGVATSINIQATSAGKVATTGDFVLAASEVNPVIKAPREHGIMVTALHSHMLTEEPRIPFMHFWVNDDPDRVADGLRAALALMKVKAP